MSDNDLQLVVEAQRGSRPAFEELVRRTSRMVYARLYLETADVHLAEDLTQETYLQAFRALARLQRPEQFRGWLGAIADNVRISSSRHRRRLKRSGPQGPAQCLGGVADRRLSPAEEAERAECREQVLAVVRTLPEEYRLPITLRYFTGADYETMEQQLGMSINAVRGMLYRGLQLLRKKLKAQGLGVP